MKLSLFFIFVRERKIKIYECMFINIYVDVDICRQKIYRYTGLYSRFAKKKKIKKKSTYMRTLRSGTGSLDGRVDFSRSREVARSGSRPSHRSVESPFVPLPRPFRSTSPKIFRYTDL